MLVDGSVAIDKFIRGYFIRSAMPDALVTDQKVRVVYYETEGPEMNIPQAKMRNLEFDVYVKDLDEHTVDRDRLKFRSHAIAERLKYLLIRNKNVQNMSFRYVDSFDLSSKIVGYTRYHIIFSYIRTT